MQSRTVQADRELRANLKRAAAEHLGADADSEAVQTLADEWYWGSRRKHPKPETLVMRWLREEAQERAREDIRKMRER